MILKLLKENLQNLKILYRVGRVPKEFTNLSLFFTDNLDYFEKSDTRYNKKDAKKYLIDLSNAEIWYPIEELDLEVNTWSAIWGKIEDFEKFGIGYEIPDDLEDTTAVEYAYTDTDWLAEAGRELGYDITIMSNIPNDRGYGEEYTEYAIHNSKVIKERFNESLDNRQKLYK